MRYGFTTGSAATAAAKAAAYMLLTGKEKKDITIMTPKGILYHADIVEISRAEQSVKCAVVHDGGDDPDVLTGTLIFAKISFAKDDSIKDKTEISFAQDDIINEKATIIIKGGDGVGKVTRKGLDQPVGEAAINHVPREMIVQELQEVCAVCDYTGTLIVEISVPDGESLAQKTFNPRLGITGGISILGTSGIVEPMSSQALMDTIALELKQKSALGMKNVAISPGNYGLDYMKKTYNFDLEKSVKCSNFIGFTLDKAREMGFEALLLTGHIGKLIKLSGGIMNTHSKEADCRMELLMTAAYKAGCSSDCLGKILDSLTTEEAIAFIEEEGKTREVMDLVMSQILYYLNKRVAEKLKVECILYSNEYGELAKSAGADELLNRIKQEENAVNA